MTTAQFSKWYKRKQRTHENLAYRALKETYQNVINEIPRSRITQDNYRQFFQAWTTTEQLYKAYEKFYTEIGNSYGTRIAKGIDRETTTIKMQNPFNTTQLFSQNWFNFITNYLRNNFWNRIVTVNENVVKAFLKSIERSLGRGDGIDDIVEALRKDITKDELLDWHLRRIARTEAGTAANLSSIQAAFQSPFQMNKVWITAEDERVRDGVSKNEWDHAAMNETEVPLEEYFIVTNENGNQEPLLYPGDPNGSAGNIINCRCAVAYKVARQANGLPIRKDKSNVGAREFEKLTEQERQEIEALLERTHPEANFNFTEEQFLELSKKIYGNTSAYTGGYTGDFAKKPLQRAGVTNLTRLEQLALIEYTNDTYKDVNRYLTGNIDRIIAGRYITFGTGKGQIESVQQLEKFYEDYTRYLQNATNKMEEIEALFPSWYEKINNETQTTTAYGPETLNRYYRGQKLAQRYWDDLTIMSEAFKTGDIVKNEFFWSTSVDRSVANKMARVRENHKAVVYEILAPEGVLKKIHPFSRYDKELEALLQPNAQWKVINFEEDATKTLYQITLKYVGHE